MFELIIVSIIWALSFVLIKGTLTGIDPTLVSSIRMLFSFLVFLPFLKLRKRQHSIMAIVIGIIQFGAMYVLYINSYQYLKGYQVALFTLTTPLFVILLSHIVEKRFSLKTLSIVILNVMATSTLVYKEIGTLGLGLVLMQLSNLCFAIGQVFYKYKFKHEKTHEMMSWSYLGAVIFCLIVTSFKVSELPVISLNQWYILIYLGIVSSGLGLYLWNRGASKVKASQLAIFNNLKVPLAVFFAGMVLSESIDWPKVMMVFSVFLISLFYFEKEERRLIKAPLL